MSFFRYGRVTTHILNFGARIFINRGHESNNPDYSSREIADINGLLGMLDL